MNFPKINFFGFLTRKLKKKNKNLKFRFLNFVFLTFILLVLLLACEQKYYGVNYSDLKVVKTSKDSLFYFNNQFFNGKVNQVTKENILTRTFHVKSGKLSGEYTVFDSLGNITLSSSYYDGKLHGPWVSFKNNNPIEMLNYNFGLMDGQRKNYWSNGLLKEENQFNLGVLTGISNFYYSNGQLRKTIAFDFNGNRDGDWLDYYPNGKIKQKISYRSSKIIDSLVRYTIEGKVFVKK